VFFAYLSGTGVPEPFRQHSVFIGLGTNVGDRCAYLTAALAALGSLVTIHQCSSVYETEPLGYGSQPWFLNMVVKATTLHQPQQLLQERMGKLLQRWLQGICQREVQVRFESPPRALP
jgi:2-amino-4-hydroxy-6-hydroxymethyldihydropteridine diphosphokinase